MTLVDPQAMVRPLLEACPGSVAVATCGACGQRIDAIARLSERGGFVHPDKCPEPPPARPPEGMLL